MLHYSSSSATDTSALLSKLKSKSLEPLTGLAMWTDEVITIELLKTERGLGFSILDYQVNNKLYNYIKLYNIPHCRTR